MQWLFLVILYEDWGPEKQTEGGERGSPGPQKLNPGSAEDPCLIGYTRITLS